MLRFNLKHILRTAALAGTVCLVGAQSAQAEFGIETLDPSLAHYGQFSRQAGEHADLNVRIEFPRTPDELLESNVHEVRVDLPPGLLGNPTNAPMCEFDDLIPNGSSQPDCPVAAQVGWAEIRSVSNGGPANPDVMFAAVFNMRRPLDGPALLAMNIGSAAVVLEPRVRAGDYGITSYSRAISQGLAVYYVNVELWGVPADSSHDQNRTTPPFSLRPTPSPDIRKPFLSNPTSCPGTPLEFRAFADSWQARGAFANRSTSVDHEGTPLLITGCENVPFQPSAAVAPQSRTAAQPTGLDVDLTVPQGTSPDGLATAHVRKTVVTLPKGMSVSSSAAAGQGACSEAQIGLGSNAAPTCPDSSRLGTMKIQTPLLDEELEGSLYLAEQRKNPFGSLLAGYLAVKGPGFYLKLPGKIEADPADGQLTTTFDNLPQLPFEMASISLRGGPGAPLIAPSTCGTYHAQVQMTSWASPVPVTLDAPMVIDGSCAGGGFDPALKAGTTNPVAGAFSPFLLRLTRQDGEQNVSRIDATLPEGLLAKLAGVPLCGNAAAATGACPASSQIGTTTVAVGAGSMPLYVPEAGKSPTAIYLAGPYKGAPYSLVVKVPAQAGPFDLGTVAVRSAIEIDPVTTQVSVKSDSLPQILEGIPVAYRDVRVEVNRPEFTLNPTSCEAMKITSSIASVAGRTANPSARFQAADCDRLGFEPKLDLRLLGPTHRSAYPKLRATLTTRKGDANIGRAAVTLPKTEFLENAHIQTICTRVQFAADNCPAKSVYGYAKAWSPLIDQPVAGPVYLRSSSNKLPDLVASLDGPIHVDLSGRIDSVNARIRNTFDFVPDAPVTKFVLTMQGGKKGLLVNNTELCETTPRATIKFDGQNGKTYKANPIVKADCGKKGKGRKK
jgi:hypothetical protein